MHRQPDPDADRPATRGDWAGAAPAVKIAHGSVAERPNALALKARVGKTTGGSNPSASAARQGRFRQTAPDFPTVGGSSA